MEELIKEKVAFELFFQNAALNPNAQLIKGVICGYRVEEIENSLTQQARYLDKLVDELAKGRKMEKILRVAQKQMTRRHKALLPTKNCVKTSLFKLISTHVPHHRTILI